LSVDRVTAARTDRLNREYSRGDGTTLIKRHDPPVNVVRGYGWTMLEGMDR
jgi:hypothetical protein